MTCRLFIDEVGNSDVNHPAERYLSLTGIITKVAFHDNRLTPEIEALKAGLFGHNPPKNTVVLHRKEILRREPPFHMLRDPATNALWEGRILGLVGTLPYIALTVMIDKHAHRDKYSVWLFNPYHYCMRAMIERYVLWLNRHRLQGDVIVESRFRKVDKSLKRSFAYTYKHGTENIPASVVQKCLTSREIKFGLKADNICGLQLVDLLAHPSHYGTRERYAGIPMRPSFGSRIYASLRERRFSRNPRTLIIDGWGQKWLP